jgi:hypothetical protein
MIRTSYCFKSRDEEKPKLRVAAYCRVSTDSEEQASSYEAQIEHYTAYINGHPDWTLAGIYADDGISGTNTKKREEFNRMIDECMAGNIDMVITKSISRFARNTLDCLKYIRQLKEKSIPVYFEKENINSMDSKGEVMLICGNCGEVFRRVHWNNRGKKSIVWRCVSRLENTGLFCDARTVLESTIEQVLITAINQTLCDKDAFLTTLQKNIETVLCHENDTTLAGIDKRLEELQTQLLMLASSKADYEDVADEIYRLREQKQKAQVESAGRDELRKRIDDMRTFLREQPTVITNYDEQLVRRLIEKVTVYEGKFTVEFKSGVTVDVEG